MEACRAHGFTLIEVLVAALVLAIGIVGVMASQVGALRTRQGSALMSAAVQLAAGAGERMRANGGARDAYLGFDYDAARDGPPQPVALNCFGNPCSEIELSAFDLAELRLAVHGRFPGGRMLICRDAALAQDAGRLAWECTGGAGAPVAVKIGWIERGAAAPIVSPALALMLDGGPP